MALTPAPTAPDIADQSTFQARSQAWVVYIKDTLIPELNAIIGATIPAGSAAAGTLTGATLAANVTASSLTSLGTLTALTNTGNTVLGNATSDTLRVTSDVLDMNTSTGPHYIKAAVSSNIGLIVQQGGATDPSGISVLQTISAPNNTSSYFYAGSDNATLRFKVYSNGGIANFSANNVNLSDQRVKPIVESLRKKGLIPAFYEAHKRIDWVRFKYGDQTHDDFNYGTVAQHIREIFKEVAPELVDLWETDRMVQVTRKVPREVPDVVERNGAYVLTSKTIDVDEPVSDEFPLVDDAGKTVMVKIKDAVMVGGVETVAAVYVPALHRVPKMELRPASDLLAIYGEDLKNITGMIVTELQRRHDGLAALLVTKAVLKQVEVDALI